MAKSTHVSRFEELLLARILGLFKGLSGNNMNVFFDFQKPQDFFESLVNIIGPIRQFMFLKCQSRDANLKYGKASQIESVPIELLALVNFILEGIGLSEKDFSKESLPGFNL